MFVAHDAFKCCGMSTHVRPFRDSGSSPTLRSAGYLSTGNMSIESCLAFCALVGYKYAGVEYGEVSFHPFLTVLIFTCGVCSNAVSLSFFHVN